MAKKVKNIPAPEVLMVSLRSIGYNFKTAIADVVDNSISAKAKNIFITSPINEEELYVSILDDGNGMDEDSLFNAMKYGSEREKYDSDELGRFGMGLKSASLSQCRVLTVASKFGGNIKAIQWDLDKVFQEKDWCCLKLDDKEIEAIPNISSLEKLAQGTLVVWQNFDIAYKKNDGRVRDYIANEMNDAENHLQLIFHRYLSRKFNPLKIYINNKQLIAYDPFLENHPKTDTREPIELNVDSSKEDSKILVQPYILPYQTDLSDADLVKIGGVESLRNGQGFYIYRNERLIVYGTWFRLSKTNISNELLKYGRIKVDIPNTLDDTWEIDIKKQNAVIPKNILNSLKKIVTDVCVKSKSKTSKRTKLTLDKDDSKIWNKKLSRDNKDMFFINTDNEFVKNFIDDFDDKEKTKIIRFIEIVSSSIPIEDIYNSICNKNNETHLSNEMLDLYVSEGLLSFKRMKQITKQTDEVVLERLGKYEPFNDEKIISLIKERISNEKC